MNVAIIGCGYVGTAVAKCWQQKMTLMITATTTTPERVLELQNIAQKVVVLQGSDRNGLESVLHGQDCVLLSVAPNRGSSYKDTYLQTAETVVEAIKKSSIKQLIYTSTCSLYGDKKGVLVDEETPTEPESENQRILNQTEQVLLTELKDKLHVCILRLGGIYGVNRELVKIYSRIAGKTRPGDGSEAANWIHLDDIVGAIEFARHYHLQGIYNLVDDANLSSREIIDSVCEVHNLPRVTWDTSQSSDRYYNARISNQKIKDAGYKLIHPQMLF
ncbi:NAD-dependent epimerase/dehydratase family protein [Brunnivagina elsteri]|uniref:NAD(P)-dependent oxidoreductase n=1 Tax=Brunnivagina elsteri CCALA 953 TaxID=987040 RepID=A0A2A2TG70_9CYAN|nr:NAD-dependent epimerase/dehydratase family protein [Calothrix elsteri]PAX52713.1 NAD(P)-dependent oxidoreductase [Calothrix elsteri CCALA 953]